MRNDFDNFDRSANRMIGGIFAIALLWILFLIGAGSTVIYILGHWAGAW